MKVLHDPHEIYAQLDYQRSQGKQIGLVPTMGALHDGHLSLVGNAKQQCDVSVATIFVNPTQFAPTEDLDRYPRTLESDLERLQAIGCDYVFVPSADKIYRPGHSTYIEPPQVAQRWEGEIRPGHFRGVATIVLKLFQMIPAHVAFFGQKDYQQIAVIRAMVDDLNVPIRIQNCETVRESDGLAMSSRNRYLSADDRVRALGLWNALCRARELIASGETNVAKIEAEMVSALNNAPVDAVDYARVVDTRTMEPLAQLDESGVAIIAARVGTTRLIDNEIMYKRKT